MKRWMYKIAFALAVLGLIFQEVLFLVFGLMFTVAGFIMERQQDDR